MHSLTRSWMVFALALAVAACKDSTGPEKRVTPREIQKVAGDEQQAMRGHPLASPLRVRVLGSDGRALAGASIDWSAPDGSTIFESTRSTTNSSGEAETRVTALGAIGTVEIRAAVTGIAPVSFSMEGLDPCLFAHAPALVLGTIRPGALSTLDCMFEGWANDVYVFSVPTTQAVVIRNRAPGFDPLVRFYPFGGWWLNLWDPVDETRDAKFKALLPAGNYGVVASSLDANVSGAYEVSVTPTTESVGECEFVLTLVGITTRQQLASSDCSAETSDYYFDAFALVLEEGEQIRIAQSSSVFAPRMEFFRDGELLAEQAGIVGGAAVIEYTADAALAMYFVIASSADPHGAGAYDLTIDRSVVVGSSSAARRAQILSRGPRTALVNRALPFAVGSHEDDHVIRPR